MSVRLHCSQRLSNVTFTQWVGTIKWQFIFTLLWANTPLVHFQGPPWLPESHKMIKPTFGLPLLPTTQSWAGVLLPSREQIHTQRHLTCNFAIGFWGRLPIYNYGPGFSLFTHNCHILGWRSRSYKITRLSVILVHSSFIHHFCNTFLLKGAIRGVRQKS